MTFLFNPVALARFGFPRKPDRWLDQGDAITLAFFHMSAALSRIPRSNTFSLGFY